MEMGEIAAVYHMLEDEESKDIWINRMNYLITDDYRYIEYIVKNYCYTESGAHTLAERQYFDEPFIQFGDDEVFIDAGAFDLTTALEFAKRCKSFKKIYSFEPDKTNINVCLKRKDGDKRIEIVPYGTWSSQTELRFKAFGNWQSMISKEGEEVISVTSIDEVVKEKVTYLKMDVEGAELETLKGAKKIICRDKPNLAVCIYHKPEDMTELPLYIKSLVAGYKLYVRHYSEEKYETVLYAIYE